MGDYSLSCALSGLTIKQGDKIGFVMLKPSYPEPIHSQKLTEPRQCTVGSNEYWIPYLPIVFGEYEGYGTFHEVTRNVTTDFIEDYFHKPTVDVINVIGNRDRTIYYDESPILELYKPQQVTDVELGYNTTIEEGLTTYGFVKDATQEDRYTFENYVLFKKDHNWLVTTTYKNGSGHNNVLRFSRYGTASYDVILDAFARLTRVFPGFKPEDYDAVSTLASMSGMVVLEQVYTSMMKSIKEWDDHYMFDNHFHEGWEQFNKIVSDHETAPKDESAQAFESPLKLKNKLIGNFFDDRLREFLKIELENTKLLTRYYGSEEIFNAYKLPNLFQSVNRIIEPSLLGQEFGNHEALRILHAAIGEVLDERDKQREEDGY